MSGTVVLSEVVCPFLTVSSQVGSDADSDPAGDSLEVQLFVVVFVEVHKGGLSDFKP